MFDSLISRLKKGIEKITNNPQLIYTILIALFITGSFVFMAERFIKIANDSQERLINVRIGSLQDAFVAFAGDKIEDTEYLNGKIEDIISVNETIKSFKVIIKKNISTDPDARVGPDSYIVVASNDKEEIDEVDIQASFLYTLALSNPTNSMTIAFSEDGERLFKTGRAITDERGNVLGVVTTIQTLSLADIIIEESITNGRILLFVVIMLILILFFRHSRIIDYMTLYKQLKGVNQLKDDFISMASHELRTPLSAIRGYAELASEATEITPPTKEFLSRINISAKDLDALISDMLDVSRIEQGRMRFEAKKINPKETIDAVVESLALSAKEKGLGLSFDKTKVKDDQFINADIARLRQVLVNLIGNAVKYTNKGEIVIRQYQEKTRLYIRVSDTGLGLTAEEREKLFEKFYRVKNEETEKIRGTGLGLWITARIVKEMSGNISVESIKGVGSHFIVSFPIIS